VPLSSALSTPRAPLGLSIQTVQSFDLDVSDLHRKRGVPQGSSRQTELLPKGNSTSSGTHQRGDCQLYLGVTLRYDFPRNVALQCPTCFEGEQVTPAHGDDYATHSSRSAFRARRVPRLESLSSAII